MRLSLLKWLILSSGVLIAATAVAQEEQQPLVEVEFEIAQTIPGQSLPLRITVLVPTWMPKPVVFPSFEVPNVRTRLPERATFPTSRRVGNETWSGVTRTYHLTPLVPGNFLIPPQTLVISYAKPGDIHPAVTEFQTEALSIRGVVPEGAESLRPFIAADSITLEQTVTEKTTGLSPGDSIERTLLVRIEGGSPYSLPALLPEHFVPGLAEYPDAPVINENEDGQTLSGTRLESLTLMAEGGGSGSAPPVSLRWYNLQSGEIETETAPGFDVSIVAPPPPPAPVDYKRIATRGLLILLILIVFYPLLRSFWSRFSSQLTTWKEKHRASEDWAFRQLRHMIRSRNYAGTLDAIEAWSQRSGKPGVLQNKEVARALGEIGNAAYSKHTSKTNHKPWSSLYKALNQLRQNALRDGSGPDLLAPLNPSRRV